jgi:type II secretory pathway pseudopilin PulG
MSILANAKNKAASGSVKAAFTNEDGAIDLASIMVGIIVIGLIGGVIAATVFAVIPWAQDNAAKQQLDSVASAQSAYVGLSADDGAGNVGQIKFGNATDLNTGKSLFDAGAAKVSIATNGQGTAAHYGAAIASSSGKVYYITDKKTQPTGVATAALAKTAVEGVTGTGTVWTGTTGPVAATVTP